MSWPVLPVTRILSMLDRLPVRKNNASVRKIHNLYPERLVLILAADNRPWPAARRRDVLTAWTPSAPRQRAIGWTSSLRSYRRVKFPTRKG
jgi:hypothetical protein